MLYIVLFKRCSFQNNFLWCHSVWNLWTSYSEPIRFAVILCIRNRSVLLWSFVFGTILFCCDPLYSEQFSFAMILCIQNHSVLLWSFVFGTIQFVVILCIQNHSVCCDPLYWEPFSFAVICPVQFFCPYQICCLFQIVYSKDPLFVTLYLYYLSSCCTRLFFSRVSEALAFQSAD